MPLRRCGGGNSRKNIGVSKSRNTLYHKVLDTSNYLVHTIRRNGKFPTSSKRTCRDGRTRGVERPGDRQSSIHSRNDGAVDAFYGRTRLWRHANGPDSGRRGIYRPTAAACTRVAYGLVRGGRSCLCYRPFGDVAEIEDR